MKIDNAKIYGLSESIVASGLPMALFHNGDSFREEVDDLREDMAGEKENRHIRRARKLAANPAGSGHCNFLSGIVVQANIRATNAWWLQAERYHFFQIVSMQSKMHMLEEMADSLEKFLHPAARPLADYHRCGMDMADDGDFDALVYNCPMGLELTGRVSTNYLQLKTIYNQRKNHKLAEWRDFCTWIEGLEFSELITGKEAK